MNMAQMAGAGRIQPRLVLQLKTGVGQGGRAFDAEILNLSTTGILLRSKADLSLQDPIQVVLPGSGAVGAKVVWSADGLYGCMFAKPIGEDELESLRRLSAAKNDNGGAAAPAEETIGMRIKRLRVSQGHTMRGLADKVGVSKPTLWKWEGDQVRPRHETLQVLAAELGVSELELVYGAPGLGEAAALADDEANAAKTLADIVRASRRRIARAAGVDEANVQIQIDWDAE